MLIRHGSGIAAKAPIDSGCRRAALIEVNVARSAV
jgi:hypothetical protein